MSDYYSDDIFYFSVTIVMSNYYSDDIFYFSELLLC